MFAARLDDASLLASEEHVFGGPIVGTQERMKTQFLINDPRGLIGYESFAAGATVNWAFWHDETHIIMGGEAKVTYTLAPNHRKQVTKIFRKGDVYLIPNGARVRFEVTPEGPYLHACVIMPRFDYPKDERLDAYT